MLVENNTTASTATTVYITLTNGNNGSSMMLSTPKNGIMKRAMPNQAPLTLNRDDLADPAKLANKPVQKFMVSISATNSPTIRRRNAVPATAPVPSTPAAGNQRTEQKNDQQIRNLLFKEQLRQKIDELTLNDLKLNLKTIFPDNKCNPHIDSLTPRKAHSTPDLMQKIDDTCVNGVDAAAAEKKRQAKRVMFADDRGFQLVTIRILSEPRDFPPNFRYQEVVDLLGCGFYNSNRTAAATSTPASSTVNTTDGGDNEVFAAASPAPKLTTNWQCKFKQPASDYMAFRQKLDQNKVALENVLIKNDETTTNNNNGDINSDSSSSLSAAKMTGTIKVKNLSFEKSVVLRLSTDQWSTFVDHQCKYKPYRKVQQNNTSAPAVRCPDIYDTFDFEIDLKNDGK
uniref:CBM21 domain-containing protein n=1 Tax=Romanomermis culicivorax TaxID=13658 RepID=A0A915KW34_ROMCU